jgi:DNA-binding NtrC family response regulator
MRDESRIRVLIAEDEAHLGTLLENYLTGRGFQVTTRRDGRAALDAMKAEAYDVALLDIVMPELDGLEVLRQVREEPSPPEVIIITGNGTIETAISAMKLGAYDYLSKPYRMAEIDVLVRRAWEKRQLARENVLLQKRLSKFDGLPEIVTHYAPMQAVLSLVERVAKSDSTVLISGESGTGIASTVLPGQRRPRRHQLRRDRRESARERALRSREGCVYRRALAKARSLRARGGRDNVHG